MIGYYDLKRVTTISHLLVPALLRSVITVANLLDICNLYSVDMLTLVSLLFKSPAPTRMAEDTISVSCMTRTS